jgi:DNA polymerase-3 subunit delta
LAKADARRFEAALRDLGAWRAVLLLGDDAGLIRERSQALRAAVVGGDDPFRVMDLSREAAQRDPSLLAGEMQALSLTGGRRWIRIREATDALAPAVSAALETVGPALLVIEAPELPGRSRLRALLEDAPDALVVACWRERGEALAGTLGGMLREAGVTAQPQALEWLASRLAGDREVLRREAEKLAAYAGPGGLVDEAAALAMAPEDASLDLEDALFAATEGEVARADRALDAALAEGLAPVQLLRAALRHVQRLHLVAGGTPVDSLRPPVFFRYRPAFEHALRLWDSERLARAAQALVAAERRAKSGSVSRPIPDATVARTAILGLAQQAALLSRR